MKRATAIIAILAAGSALVTLLPAAASQSATAGSCVESPDLRIQALATDVPVQQQFSKDLKAGLVAARLAPQHINELLAPLVAAGLTAAAKPSRKQSPMLHSQSISEVSDQRRALRDLEMRLRQKYRLPRSTGCSGPDLPPAVDAWISLLRANDQTHVPAAKTPIRQFPTEPQTLRWSTPLRIATTGNTERDAAVSAALRELRSANPRLPLDDRTFPNPIGDANMFLNWEGVVCPADSLCNSAETAGALREAATLVEPGTYAYRLVPLVFFAEIRGHGWQPAAPIYRVKATHQGSHTAAWIRTDGRGHIRTATCDRVPGFRAADNVPNANDAAGAERLKNAAKACIAAALGAPVELSAPWWRDVQKVPGDQTPDLDQLAQLALAYN